MYSILRLLLQMLLLLLLLLLLLTVPRPGLPSRCSERRQSCLARVGCWSMAHYIIHSMPTFCNWLKDACAMLLTSRG
jgi:hypothetical protein